MKLVLPIYIVLLAVTTHARTWKSPDGREIKADVVKVNADRTVVLKTSRAKTVPVAFNTFVEGDVQHLDYLLSRKGRGKLHAVPWNELNALFGLDIWKDDNLWDDSTSATAKRMKLKKESKTDFMENYRAYPRGKKRVLNEPVFASSLYGDQDSVDSISIVFLNQGDMPMPSKILSPDDIKAMNRKIAESGMHVHNTLVPILGKPKRDTLGKGDMREKVWRWNWNGHAIMVSLQEGKYAALRIMPAERADHGGRMARISEAALKARMGSCVDQRKNGDVLVRNIPMINQGPKGYCSPATWERYLRYMDIPADMYLLALAGNTGIGGGTSSQKMLTATKSLISANGRELEELRNPLSPDGIAEYIDMGLPIMWRLLSTPEFQTHAMNNTARRLGKEEKYKNDSGQSEDDNAGGHICLIIGYNKETDEIAISDSWGPRFAERWVKTDEAQRASNNSMHVIKW